ncbi:MAG: alpha/beta hydrolase fold domain-containing protein, partial [Rhodospirillaceae bacterium]|nr:alpha/beta hydrolase fold domain-containing protein [Rhodospirillaceae bacterium]
MPPLTVAGLDAARRAFEDSARWLYPTPAAAIAVADERPDGVPRLRLYRAAEPAGAAILFFHGGGFVMGSLESHDALCRDLAARTAALVVSVDYRRAPEHRFPAALDDARAALQWLRRHAAHLGVSPDRIAV